MIEHSEYVLVRVKRSWVPDWLYAWFCPTLGTKQPFRWILHREIDEFTSRRINGERKHKT